MDGTIQQAARLLHTKRETAQLLSLSLRTIDTLISMKRLPVVRIGGRVMVRASDLLKFIKDDHPLLATAA